MSDTEFDSLADARIARGLRALPDCAPPKSAWTDIQARLQADKSVSEPARPKPFREWLLAGLAATLLGGLAAVMSSMESGGPALEAMEDGQLVSLMQESQRLELRLAEIRDGNVRPETVSELESYLALVDLQLASNQQNTALWQQRVQLLDTLVSARSELATNPIYQL